MFVPAYIIDLAKNHLEGSGKGKVEDCGGLPDGGYLIGLTERSLIFLFGLMSHFDPSLSFSSTMGFVSIIVTGKAIFRFSSRQPADRACADWYILGTFLSITAAVTLTWTLFTFIIGG